MNGAANNTMGTIRNQACNHAPSQCDKNVPSEKNETSAIAAAIAEVIPDWMVPNTKWA